MSWDNSDSEWLDGFLFGWLIGDNGKDPMLGFFVFLIILAIVIAVLYYT